MSKSIQSAVRYLAWAAALAVVLAAIPVKFDSHGAFTLASAFAKNGNGHDNGGGNGNAGGNDKGNGDVASALGGLNAGHASAEAFLNASPNSRVGKIAAYEAAADSAEAAVAAAALADAAPGAAVEGSPADITADTAEMNAAAALATEQTALNAAANKTPVSPATQAALDGLLGSK